MKFPKRVVCERPADGGRAVAVFNWSAEPDSLSLSLDRDERGWNTLEGEPIAAGRTVKQTVPAYGCLLVHVATALGRPHLLGTEHLAGFGDRLEQITWDVDETGGQLSLTLDAETAQNVWIAVPDGWTAVEVDTSSGTGPLAITASPGTTAVSFKRS